MPRDTDDSLRVKITAAAQCGGSCPWPAVHRPVITATPTKCRNAAPDGRLLHPVGPDEIAALADLKRNLDGSHGLTGAVVRALLNATPTSVLIGTMRPDRSTA